MNFLLYASLSQKKCAKDGIHKLVDSFRYLT